MPDLVLYRFDDRNWKISDFGLSAEGGSSRTHTTAYVRNTASYRAPEQVKEFPSITSKADIWALGCIFYELVAHKPAFSDDYHILQFGENGKSPVQILPSSSIFLERDRCLVRELCISMLQVEPRKRPRAYDLLQALVCTFRWNKSVVWVDCRHYLGTQRQLGAILPPSVNSIWSAIRWSPFWYA